MIQQTGEVVCPDAGGGLLRLTVGEQAQAREESWRKRPVTLPPAVTAEEERAETKKKRN